MLRKAGIAAVSVLVLTGAGCSDGKGTGAMGGSTGSGGATGAGGTTGGAGTTGAGGDGSAAGSSGGGGATGAAGTSGAAGDGGAAGSSGTAGASGAAGATGAAGRGGATGAGGAAGASGATPREEAIADLLRLRQEHGVAALRGEIYVVVGYAMNPSPTVEAYNPTTRMWRSVAAFPFNAQHPNVGVARDRIIVAGFYVESGTGNPNAGVYAYNPDADRWDAVASLPTGTERAAACTAVLNDKLYVFGGGRRGMSVADASVYDPMTDMWTKLPDMPARKEHCAAGAIGGKIYIAGGRADSITGFEPSAFVFDPANGSYTPRKQLPVARGGCASAVLRDKLYVFGGEGNAATAAGVFPNIDEYDPATDTWRALPPMVMPRHGFNAAVVGDRIYLPGGASRQGGGAVTYGSVFYFP